MNSHTSNPDDDLNHIAIIMDGNGRWAKSKGLIRNAGHRQGLETSLNIIEAVARRGIRYLSLFVLSRENMARPDEELRAIEDLMRYSQKPFRKVMHRYGIRLKIIGDQDKFSPATRRLLDDLTAESNQVPEHTVLLIAANYSGRWDILQATERMARDIVRSRENNEKFELEFADYLSTAGCPDPDLLIRSSGESRISNFMLWQLAYTELYFHDKMWPDFNEEDLDQAIEYFYSRERRFGLVSQDSADNGRRRKRSRCV